jgi:DNA-binding transcriptional LysR family regulator
MPVPVANLSMVWHRRYTNSPAHHWLRGQIAEILDTLRD